ncbi:unnamed protein product, partial [Heterosigma akashiwo]
MQTATLSSALTRMGTALSAQPWEPTTTPTPTVASTGCLTLYQYDDYGDGWNGNYFLLEDFSGADLQSVTLSDGSYGEECLVVEASTCYTFALDVQGTWTSELSWDLCGETGLAYDDAVSFCIASDLSCTLSDTTSTLPPLLLSHDPAAKERRREQHLSHCGRQRYGRGGAARTGSCRCSRPQE